MLTQTIKDLYQQRAPPYDLAVRVYQGAFGFRYSAYKKRTIELLQLKPGDTVVDLGCGTGLNFAPILADIGKSGKLIGVDLSQNMLARAAERITRYGWENVQLVESDMTA
jgi:demethylmenaquinone methyltransferase/2-methoxy-6-polyprenyl-1,4-benzoquinol methylase